MRSSTSYWEQTKDLADRNPLVAVVKAFGLLQTAVLLQAQSMHLPSEEFDQSFAALAEHISPELAELVRRLKEIHDVAVDRDATPLPADAERYQELVGKAILELRRHRSAA